MKAKKAYLIEIMAGIVLMTISFLIKDSYYSAMCFSFGLGLIAASLLHLIRLLYWENPARQDEFERKQQEAHINFVDERKQYLRMKSGQIAYQIMTVILLILSFVLALFKAELWVTAMILLLFIFQYLLGLVIYRLLENNS